MNPFRIGMLASGILLLFLFAAAFFIDNGNTGPTRLKTIPVGENESEGISKTERIRLYHDLIHRAEPGTDWQAIERENAWRNYELRLSKRYQKTDEAFADGLLSGEWHERGNDNQAGRMTACAYDPVANTLYALSDAGTVWKTPLPIVQWTLMNDNVVLRDNVLATTTLPTGGVRLILSATDNVVYSDDGGTTLQPASGITFPVAWSGNAVTQAVALNDAAGSVYALARTWDPNAGAARMWLYRSADRGATFTKIHTFHNSEWTGVSLFSPYNSDQLYIANANPDSLFSVNGSSLSLINAANPFSGTEIIMKGLVASGQLHLYALLDDAELFQSTDGGASWQFVSNLPSNSWNLLSVSTLFPNRVVYGNMETHRSSNGGQTFTVVNEWQDYYDDVPNKLHADTRCVEFFRRLDGSEFCVTGTDGGVYVSDDYLQTNSNISLTGLRVNMLWDHITAPNNPNVLFSGTQDQGLCHTADATGSGLILQDQVLSGDYGQMRITRDNTLWALYPGGRLYMFEDLQMPWYVTDYQLQGAQLPNYEWMVATAALPWGNTVDEILIGGGNVTGGGGSYLIKLSSDFGFIQETQYNFDFRTNSNDMSSGISAIAVSALNPSRLYVATEDGTFFYSSNEGNTWSKTTAFNGPDNFWLYGSCIVPSNTDPNKVYFAGSGYDNPGVYVSNDGGATFDPMSDGLPSTMVNRLAVTPDDDHIYAATDAGPFVFVKATATWYPLMSANTPACIWKTVEYIPSINTARFSTYGRGIWDFNVTFVSGTEKEQSALPITLHPNPVQSGSPLWIGNTGDNATVHLYNVGGQCVYRGKTNGVSPLQLPALPSGSYIVSVANKSATESRVLVVK